MVDWSPKEVMGPLAYYLRFKLRFWTQVDSVPQWVQSKHDRFVSEHKRKHDRPYEYSKVFVGDSLKYKIVRKSYGRKSVEINYYTKIR